MTRIGDVAIDGTVLGFAVVAAIASGILSGLAPGWMISRAAGRGAGIAAMADRLRNRNASMRIRRAMLVLEFAMAMTLLVGAGLFFRTLENLYAVELGVRHEGITTFRVAYPAADYPNPEDVRHAVDRTLEVLASHPDVATVEATSHLPLSGSRLTSSVIYEGGAREHGTNTPSVAIKVVTPGYSRALGIPLLAGRNLAPRDESGTEPVVVLNRAAAEMLWPGETAIGKWLSYENDDQDHPIRRRVVGVIGDVHFAGPAQPPTPEAYQSHAQTRDVWRWFGRDLTYAALTRSGRPLAVDAARDLLARVDPTLPVVGYRTLTEWLDSSVSTPRFQGTLVGLFAAVALLLAGAGTYGVMALAVRQQARDYGIRLAVGASRRAVLGGVVAGALRLAAVGTALGGTIAFLLSRSIRSLLWGVDGADTATYASVALLLTLATIAASLGPALRAARTDPVVVLKEE